MNINKVSQIAFENHRQGNLEQAEYFYKKVLKKQPDNPDVLHMLGVLFFQLANYDLAIKYIRKALQFRPSDIAPAHYNLGCALVAKGQFDEAITQYHKAIELNPFFAAAYNNLGRALQEKGQLGEAITQYHKALELSPFFADPYCNLGYVLEEKGQFDEAITHSLKAIELDPSLAMAYNNLGLALQGKGQLNEAVASYHKALQLNPNLAEAHWNMSLALLLLGNFKEGWKEYEWRWKEKTFLKNSCSHQPSHFSQPVWDGSSFKEKSLLIYAEQGIGDEIMFASCFQEVIERRSRCTIECDKRLIPIFARSFPEAIFVESVKEHDTSSSQLPRTDMVISLGSLPKFFRTDFDSFPKKNLYLMPNIEQVEMWHNRFKALGKGLKIGISWRGGAKSGVIRKRSIMLEQWDKLLSLSGVHFINLQYGDCKNELKEIKGKLGVSIHDWEDADPLKDLDNFAAQIAALDLIISVDNSTVHMAGALGKQVWVLLPCVPDWRWMLNREDSPWYPTMRLFRQPSSGDWESVIARIKDELLQILKKEKILLA